MKRTFFLHLGRNTYVGFTSIILGPKMEKKGPYKDPYKDPCIPLSFKGKARLGAVTKIESCSPLLFKIGYFYLFERDGFIEYSIA